MVGAKTGKIIALETRIKTCRICDYAKKSKIPVREHSCRRNWDGSAKAMESDMVVAMVKKASSAKAAVKTIVGDEDSSAIARVRAEVDPDIEKKSDSNHMNKIFGNALYALRPSFTISVKTISYIQKNFKYACKQSDSVESLRKSLDAVVKHPFGDHSSCSNTWCKHLDEPSTSFKSLPRGKALTDPLLQTKLEEIIAKYKSKADKLICLSSTQANENFNGIVSTKARKNHHVSGSESLDYRINAAAAQKNSGYEYLLAVSPHTLSISFAWLFLKC